MLQALCFQTMIAEKLHRIAAWMCLPALGVGAFIGGEYGAEIGAKFMFKYVGVYLPFYCYKCIEQGKENFITITWGTDIVTKEGNPVLFWLAMGLLIFMSIILLVS